MDTIVTIVRESVDARTWSVGIELARNATFQEVAASAPGERLFRLLQGPKDRVISVSISEQDEVWQCDCDCDEDPCRHIVATVLAVKQGKVRSGAARDVQRHLGGIEHCFSRVGGALRFDRFLVSGDERVAVDTSLLQSLTAAARQGHRIFPAESELRIDHVLPHSRSGVLDPKTMRFLLPALSRVPIVLLEGERVAVSSEPLPVVAEVIDEGDGFRIRRAAQEGITEMFDNAAALCGGTLHAVEDSALRMEEVELLRNGGTFFSRAAAVDLATRVIPQLQGKIELRVLSRSLPRARRVPPRIVIEGISDRTRSSATFIPRVVYGNPIIAEVHEGELKLVDPREIPIRERAEEGRLAREIASKFNLRLEQGTALRGEHVLPFLERLRGLEVRGDACQMFTPVGSLIPTLNFDGGILSVSFESIEKDGSRISTSLSSKELIGAWRAGARYSQLEDGRWAKLPQAWLVEHAEVVGRILDAKEGGNQPASRLLTDISELCDSLNVAPPEYFKRLASGLAQVASLPNTSLPKDLRAELRSYQRIGVNWISFLHDHDIGALLADDMGLGKTLQALCAVRGRTLVICPTSVLASWKQQCEAFRPGLSISVYHGARRELVVNADITITSYALLRLDIDALEQVEWDMVILDESQTIRNPGSQVAQAAYRLRARQRISLSGTPVENSLDDLWSQFRFLNPGLLGSYSDFQSRFVEPIQSANKERANELRRRVMPFILRRLKRDVALELPPKTEVVLHCELSSDEQIVYDAILGMVRTELIAQLDSGQGVFSALEALLRLRQACCHVGLLPGHEAPTSSKVELLMESLQASISQGHRALVFSQWTSLLDRIEPHMRRLGISFCRIDGTTEGRGDVVELFQSEQGPDVMLLSLKAGGLGLTLTAADHVYIVDPWWNPAAEDQAADRAYRIGQKNSVIVHRLVARGTIEERILQIQEEKRQLLSAALGESGSVALSRDDMLRLLSEL